MSEAAAHSVADELRREVGAAQADHERYLSSLESLANPSGDESVDGGDPAMTVLTDTAQPAQIRVELIARLGAALSRRDDYVDALLAIVRDRADAPTVREAALQVLGGAAFQVVRFRPHQQAYDDALHDLVTDPVPQLRELAVETLAHGHDPVVQEVLRAGVEGRGELPVERDRAIALLAEDDHLDNLPLLEQMYRDGDDGARQEAVRYMGSYAGARPMLEEVVRNQAESTEVRQQGAASLRNLDPDRFQEVAKEIALDSSDYPEIRTASLSALAHLGDTDQVYRDQEFLDRLAAVSTEETAPEVAQAARDLLDRRPATA